MDRFKRLLFKPGSEEHPASWRVGRLLRYAADHGMEVGSGMSKEELVRLVERHMIRAAMSEATVERMKLKKDRVDVLATTADTLLEYKPYPPYAAVLRAHPEKLQALIDAGMAELQALRTIADLRHAKCHPRLAAWLSLMVGDTDGHKALHTALTANTTSSVCGRYFGKQDVVIRCLDCGADPTCVMCIDCFRHSPCRDHRFSVTPGSGGGMCDCGDPTAWKPESFCSRHRGVQAGADPTLAMSDTDRAWVGGVLRGVVRFMTLVLQHSLTPAATIATAAEGPRAANEEADDDEAVLGQLPGDTGDIDWMADWLLPLAEPLAALEGDCAKRLLGATWMEPTPLPSAAAVAGAGDGSCLEVLFLVQRARDQGVHGGRQDPRWWSTLLQGVGNCLPDPAFRTAFAALYTTYAEGMAVARGRLHEFCVQFMTSPDTVRAMLLASPSLMPYPQPRDTVLHRILSSLVYFLSTTCQPTTDEEAAQPLPQPCPSWLFRIGWHTPNARAEVTTTLKYVLTACRESVTGAVVSRTYLRVWFAVLVVLQASAGIRGGAAVTSSDPCDAGWFSMLLNPIMWHMHGAHRSLLRALLAEEGGAGRDGSSPSDSHSGRGVDALLPPALLTVLARSTGFDVVPDRSARLPLLRDFVVGAVGGEAEEAEEGGTDAGEAGVRAGRALLVEPGQPADAYAFAYLAEVLRALDMALHVQRCVFQANDARVRPVLDRAAVPIAPYSLLAPAWHATSFHNLLARTLALAIRGWVMEQRPLQQRARATASAAAGPDLPGAEAQVRLHGLTPSLPHGAAPPLAQLTAYALGGAEHGPRREALLDALVMPFVLSAQVGLGYWRRGDRDVVGGRESYLCVGTSMGIELDVYMLQVLALHIPARDFALRLLERFSFTGRTQARSCRGLRPGWAAFLRLMLTIITDTTKATRHHGSDFAPASIARIVCTQLALRPMLHSTLLASVLLAFRGYTGDDADTDEAGASVEAATQRVIGAVAATETRDAGKMYRVKDTATWREHVSLYSPTLTDEQAEAMVTNYHRLVVREELTRRVKEDSAAGAVATPTPVPRLPPTQLRAGEQYEELVPPLRALLHTDGLLVTALHVIMQHAWNLNGAGTTPASPSTAASPTVQSQPGSVGIDVDSSRSRSSEEEEEEEADEGTGSEDGPTSVPASLLTHALTAVYLCAQDCVAISQARRAELGVAHAADAVLGTTAATAPSAILEVDWGAVEAYLHTHVAPTCTFAKAGVRRLLAIPELSGRQSIKARLGRRVPLSRLRPRAAGETTGEGGGEGSDTVTAAQALHHLRTYYRENAQEDAFSVVAMIEFVLQVTNYATFAAERSTEEAAAAAAAEAEAKSRLQRVKEKQAKLLAQLRSRGAKAASTAVQAQASTTANPPTTTASATASPPDQLHTKLLLELTLLECAVCRTSSEEPLTLLAHTSTSGVLAHLKATPLPEGRKVHSHFHVCGHAAHPSCAAKVLRQLEALHRWRSIQGYPYLGTAEFSCPVCLMICTTLAPLPLLSAAPAPRGTTLFEEIRSSTLESDRRLVAEVCDEMHSTLAQACVGLGRSSDAGAIATTEGALQRSGSRAWQLSEAIRSIDYHILLVLESAKAGLRTTALTLQQDGIALLSLLTSVNPEVLKTHWDALEQTFTHSGEDYCRLLMRVLRRPGQAGAYVSAYARAYMAATPAAVARRITGGTQAEEEEEVVNMDVDAVVGRVWRELGRLTLLRIALGADSEDEAGGEGHPGGHGGSGLAHLLGGGGTSSDSDAEAPTLEDDGVATPAGRLDGATRMWGFLQRRAAAAASLADVVVPTPSVVEAGLGPYTGPEAYRTTILEQVLHMPRNYMDVIARHADARYLCGECGQHSKKPVVCCYCAQHLCLQPSDTTPELFAHSRTCAGGLGLYMTVRGTGLVVLDATAVRVVEYQPVYTDAHGETDSGLRRGRPLKRNDALALKLLGIWMRSRWGVESAIIKRSWCAGAQSL